MQQEFDALKIALLQDDDAAGQAAVIAVLGSALLLFERAVVALERIADNGERVEISGQPVDPFLRPGDQ